LTVEEVWDFTKGSKAVDAILLTMWSFHFDATGNLYQKAADMLLNAKVDVAFFVSTHLAAYMIQLIESKSVKLVGLEQAEAYALLHHYLYFLKVPEGVIDFVANIPDQDLTMVAPTSQLVAHPDLHLALINMLLMAAKVVHKYV
jgi:TRAP-type uncharacterized transport system substrate-binding protein